MRSSASMVIAAGLFCACKPTWHLDINVTVPPNVQAAYAESLPAAVFIAGRKLDRETGTPVATAFAPQTIGLICEPSTMPLSFRATLKDSGCDEETQVQAWLGSVAGLRDFLDMQPSVAGSVAGTDQVSAMRSSQGPLPRNVVCDNLEPLATNTIYPSASPSSTSPHAEATAFLGQHSGDCDRETDHVNLRLETPDE